MVRSEEVAERRKEWSFGSQNICLDKSHLNNLLKKKNTRSVKPLTNNIALWSMKNSLGSSIYFLFINNKKILNNVKYFLKITKSCLPLQKKFSMLQIWNVGALGQVKCTHKGKDGFPAWWWGVQAPQPDYLGSQSRTLPISCGNVDKFFFF